MRYDFAVGMLAGLVISDPNILGGTPVFDGTRVPVQTLIEYRQGGLPVYEFLLDFPTVQRVQAKQFLQWLEAEGISEAKAKLEQLRLASQKQSGHGREHGGA